MGFRKDSGCGSHSFQMAFSWLINGGDPNLLSGMILHTWRRHGSHGYLRNVPPEINFQGGRFLGSVNMDPMGLCFSSNLQMRSTPCYNIEDVFLKRKSSNAKHVPSI